MKPAAPRCLVLALVAVAGSIAATACGSGNESTQATLVPPVEVTRPGVTEPIAPSTAVGRPGTAPCTAHALIDGIAAADTSVDAVATFTCDGQWASATGASGTVFLLEANGPRWSVVDGSSVCSTATIPAAVRSSGCPPG
jgi:hypothetical protein